MCVAHATTLRPDESRRGGMCSNALQHVVPPGLSERMGRNRLVLHTYRPAGAKKSYPELMLHV